MQKIAEDFAKIRQKFCDSPCGLFGDGVALLSVRCAYSPQPAASDLDAEEFPRDSRIALNARGSTGDVFEAFAILLLRI